MLAERYVRQVKIIGHNGQAKLAESSIFIVGCGGLGCPISLYTAAAGVGRITIIDDDVVSLSNLHRQILFDERDIGLPKVKVACDKLRKINADVEIFPVDDRLNDINVERYITGHDLVIIGCDNFLTRYIVNDACCKLNIPFINASVMGDEGALAYFDIEHGCYRCLFPEAPLVGIIPLLEHAGVLGPMVGVIGTAAATMAVEILVGHKEPYVNNIFNFDSLTLGMKKFSFAKEKSCRNCQV